MNKTWWKESVVYQIYPRSFYDSNGDGIGDLQGIVQKLDYLKELGVDVIWLSPVYKSPNDDNGYDISSYREIMPEFGTMDDWEELLEEMHKRDIKLVMDLVVNHTSDEHDWFQESRTSKTNPYRDYYIWKPPKNGKEPNNWSSFFGGSAWQYDEQTGEYYLHLFSKKQPDLNWENPKLRSEIYDMMHWWLQKGVDGFRMDVINMISKNPSFPDAPIVNDDPYHFGGKYFINGPRLLEFLTEMKQEVLSKYDILTVGETPLVTPKEAIQITNEDTGSLNMLFQFEHVDLDADPRGEIPSKSSKTWQLADLKQIMSRWQIDLGNNGWNSIYLNNHDQPRSVSRFGNDDKYRVESAKMLATFTHLMQGTPFIYQGEEIGMTNVSFASIEDYRDIDTLNKYQNLIQIKGLAPVEALSLLKAKSRDNARTPIQWNSTKNGGFTSGKPWIKINPNYSRINVEQAQNDSNSIFYYYQKLIELRKKHPVFVYGTYEIILEEHPRIYAFTRTLDDIKLLIILNFSDSTTNFALPKEIQFHHTELLIRNYDVPTTRNLSQFELQPYEALVYRLIN